MLSLYKSSVRLFHEQRRRFDCRVDSLKRLLSFLYAREPGNGTRDSLVLFNVLSIEGFGLQIIATCKDACRPRLTAHLHACVWDCGVSKIIMEHVAIDVAMLKLLRLSFSILRNGNSSTHLVVLAAVASHG